MTFKQLIDELRRYSLVDAKINKEGEVESVTIGVKDDPSTYETFNEAQLDELDDLTEKVDGQLSECNIFGNKYTLIDPAERDEIAEGSLLETSGGLYSRVFIIRQPIRVVKKIATTHNEK